MPNTTVILPLANDFDGVGLGPGSIERLEAAWALRSEYSNAHFVCSAGVGGTMLGVTEETLGSMQAAALKTWGVSDDQLITNQDDPSAYGTGNEVLWGLRQITQNLGAGTTVILVSDQVHLRRVQVYARFINWRYGLKLNLVFESSGGMHTTLGHEARGYIKALGWCLARLLRKKK